jgi:hypothetical protein
MSYFNFFGESAANEYSLYNDNTLEVIEMVGIPIKYLPRTAVKQDDLFGEDVLSTYSEVIVVKMYLEDHTTFGGQGDIFAKFGLEVNDTLKLKVQQDHIISLLGSRPQVGDLMQFPFNKDIFEITFVEDEEIFYIAGKQTTFTLSAKKFVYSSENMETGDEDIDILDNETKSGTDDSDRLYDDVLVFDESSPFGDGH